MVRFIVTGVMLICALAVGALGCGGESGEETESSRIQQYRDVENAGGELSQQMRDELNEADDAAAAAEEGAQQQ
ncbi:MAG: hypothetical protein IT364_11540 [Candidatus Hydrogenedentes bacterium]|nr:hypothetical protein [Candidatus Hydrogenedentota bacterium]